MQLKRRSPLALQETERGKPAVLSKFYRYKYVLPLKIKPERLDLMIVSSDYHEKNKLRSALVPMMMVATHNYPLYKKQQHTDDDVVGGTYNVNINTLSSAITDTSSQSKAIPISSYNDYEQEETTSRNRSSDNNCTTDNIENEETIIFRQLSILKRGRYWKHLPREGQEQEEQPRTEGTLPRESWRNIVVTSLVGRKDENKENSIRSRYHPNVVRTVTEISEEDVDGDDNTTITEIEEIRDDGGCLNGSNSNPFVEYALTRTDRIGGGGGGSIGSLRSGFYIHAITEDGWMCSNHSLHDTDTNNDKNFEVLHDELEGEEEKSRLKVQQLSSSSSLLLLRLPKKVAALGRERMHVQAIGLVKRRDNSAIEPCNYYHNRDGDISIRSASEQLYGRILL